MNRHAHHTTPLRTIYDRVWRRQAPPRHRVNPVLPWGWINAPANPGMTGIVHNGQLHPYPSRFKGGVFVPGVGFMSHLAASLYYNTHYGDPR